MPELEDDIARIAALRGKPAADYTAAEHQRRLVSFDEVASLFGGIPPAAIDFAALDKLPSEARALLTVTPCPVSACRFREMAARHGMDVAIRAVQFFLPAITAAYAKQHYGPAHPQVRRA